MTRTEKNAFVALGIIAAIALAWMLWKRYQAARANNPAQVLPTAMPDVANATGFPVSNPIQFGQNLPFQVNLDQYNVPIPTFHYSGNSQIYMPLFGFVGYSQYAAN